MGSRAVVVVCRDEQAARERFGVDTGETGAIYTRTGRPFFDHDARDRGGTRPGPRGRRHQPVCGTSSRRDWLVLDCELMPWSAKAMDLVRRQYASVGAAAHAGLTATLTTLEQAAGRGLDVDELIAAERGRLEHVDRYRRRLPPLRPPRQRRRRPAPRPVSPPRCRERGVFIDRDHPWHLERLRPARRRQPRLVHPHRPDRRRHHAMRAARRAAIAWWEQLTASGGEGMVVKPIGFTARGRKGLAQPGIKCRGREYLRIIYGPEYPDASQIDRLRPRNLARKRGTRHPRVRARRREPDPLRHPAAALPGARMRLRQSSRWRANPSTQDSEIPAGNTRCDQRNAARPDPRNATKNDDEPRGTRYAYTASQLPSTNVLDDRSASRSTHESDGRTARNGSRFRAQPATAPRS